VIIGIIKETSEENSQIQKESLIQKIEADLYTEKTKKNRSLTNDEIKTFLKNYGEIKDNKLITTEGSYEIPLEDIPGWEK
jgi:hypothetical protein